MKKVMLATVFTALLLGGCSNSSKDSSSESSSSATATSSTVAESTVESSVESTVETLATAGFADQAEVGAGTFDLINQSGSTAEGADIVIYYDTNTFPTWVDVSTADVDGSLLSYVYVDGQLITKEQLGTSQTTIELQDTATAIAEGKHTVQLVQYEDNSESGNIVTFKTQEYTLKLK